MSLISAKKMRSPVSMANSNQFQKSGQKHLRQSHPSSLLYTKKFVHQIMELVQQLWWLEFALDATCQLIPLN
jgi:hypothetical protein